MNLKLLVCVLFCSSFGIISSSHASVKERRGLSNHHHHYHYPSLLRDRRLTTTTTTTKDDLCNNKNLELLETGLEEYFLYWFGESTYILKEEESASSYKMRYNCHCKLQQQELVVNCHGLGMSPLNPNETIELQDTAIYQEGTTDNDGYELKTTWWGDSYFGNASLPQEVYHYHPTTGQLDSCHGRNCQSCRVCASSWTVEMDCRTIGYYFSCHNNYTGGFLNEYGFLQQESVDTSGGSPLFSWSTSLLLCWTSIALLVECRP